MKRIIGILFCVCLLFCVMALTVQAAPTAHFYTEVSGSENIAVNDNFTFKVYIRGTYDSYSFTVSDNSRYTVVSIDGKNGAQVSGDTVSETGLDNTEKDKLVATVTCKAGGTKGSVTLEVGNRNASGTYSGSYVWSSIYICDHQGFWDENITTPATCLQDGLKTLECTKCGETKTETIAKETVSHSFGTPVRIDDSQHKVVCSVCGLDESTDHSYTVSHTPSADDEGKHKSSCACGDFQLNAHNFGDWQVITAATCNGSGEDKRTCSLCHKTETRTVDPTGLHAYVGGWIYVDGVQHKKECTVCHEVAYGNHAWGTGTVTVEPICDTEGTRSFRCPDCNETKTETIPETGRHRYDDTSYAVVDNSTHTLTCNDCGNTETVAHTWHYSKVDSSLHKKYCDCGETSYLAHTWNSGVVTVDPTEEREGQRKYTCSLCQAQSFESIPKSDHEHAYGRKWEKDSSNHWMSCACGDKIDIAEHSFDEGVLTKLPSCKGFGEKLLTCTVCGETKTEEVPFSEHVLGEFVVTKEPTCNEEGQMTNTCAVCGLQETRTVPVLEHIMGEPQTVKEPTCSEVGQSVRKCTLCGEVMKEETIPVKEHNYGEWVIGKGIKTRVCNDCSFSETQSAESPVEELRDEETGLAVHSGESDTLTDTMILIVTDVTHTITDEERQALIDAASNLGKRNKILSVYDVSIEKNGVPYQLAGTVEIDIPMPTDEAGTPIEGSKVTYAENGTLRPVPTAIRGEKLFYTADGLGRFAVIMDVPLPTSEGMDTWVILLICFVTVAVPVFALIIILIKKKREDEEEEEIL